MKIIGPIWRKYATATTIYFPLERISSDDIEDGPATLAAGDARFSEDGAAFAATNGTIAHVDEGLYSLALLSTEVTGAVAHIRLVDQTSPKTFIDTLIIIETYGNASAQHAVDLDDAVRAGLTALPSSGTLVAAGPTNAQMEARTLAAAGYFDPTADAVANVTLTATTTTLTNKTGFSLAATGLDAIASTATGMVEIAKAVWDRVLNGANHNVPSSAGRRLRNLQDFGLYEGGAVWLDTVGGVSGTTDFENGTVNNPCLTIEEAKTIADSVGLVIIHFLPGSSDALSAALDGYELKGFGYTLAFAGFSIDATLVEGATISGTFVGTPIFKECVVGNVTGPGATLIDCRFGGTITNNGAGAWYLHNGRGEVAGPSASLTFDFGAGVANTALSMRNWSGGVEVQNMGQTGTDTMTVEGNGKFTEGTGCGAMSPNIRGNFHMVGITNLTPVVTANVPSAATEARLAELDAANIPADLDNVLTDTADMQPKIGTLTDLGGGATLADNLSDMAGATFATATDSQEAIRNHATTIKTVVDAIDALTKASGDGDLAAVLVDTGTTIPALIGALNDPTAAVIAAAILAAGDIDGYSLEEAQKLVLAMATGKLSGAATVTNIIRAADDSKARITATVDSDGNRTALTLDATG